MILTTSPAITQAAHTFDPADEAILAAMVESLDEPALVVGASVEYEEAS